MKKSIVILSLGVILISAANATTILGSVDLENHNNSLSDYADLYFGHDKIKDARTGIYSWTNSGSTGLGSEVPNWGFCIELTQSPKNGWNNVILLEEAPLPTSSLTPMGITKANAIRELWGRYFNSDWLIQPANKDAEAFSACIWEIVFETDSKWDVTKGHGFRADDIERWHKANTWLAGLTGDSTCFANLVAVSSSCGQDYVVEIPEPATLVILTLGSLFFARRKK